ncbi:Uncharacterized protein Adt_46192 [Abeliophyllum distichum]|uniref:Transposase (putative) gypsy type domain-containing protein n=1 Tax=Abeliophyllum distichum TaxID=126358 RepID=A0ABD1P3F6_9LAMI
MEGVLPIRGVDRNTGEALPIDVALGLREADDPFRVDVVRWTALDVPSIMVEEDLTKLVEAYRIPANIELILLGPNERACFSRRGCTVLHLNVFVSGMRLPLQPMLRRILRAYDLAPTQVAPNGWSQMVGGHVFMASAFVRHGNTSACVPNYLSAEEVAEEEGQGGGSRVRVFDDPEPDLDVPNVYGIADSLPYCELSRDIVDVLRSIYQTDQKTRSYGMILNRHRCLVELGLMASKAEMDQGRRPRPTLACLTKQRPKILVLGSAEDTSQRKAIEDLSREGNKEAVEASKVIEVDDAPGGKCLYLGRERRGLLGPELLRRGEVPWRSTQALGGGDGGPFDSKRQFRELIGAPGARIPDDALRNLLFYPSMGAQAMKKYFTPKWEEFSSHRELEDVLEASLASAIRASAMQLKVLGEFRTRMQEQRNLITEVSKSDKEHKQALEELQAILDSARTAYEQMEADLKESDSNVLNLTKQLDNANTAQKFTSEALEAANGEKRRLLAEAKLRDDEIQSLRRDLESFENGRKEAEAGRKEVEVKLANAEADFVANFHNTEAYTNFSDYFARVGEQEVLTALRKDRPNLDIGSLEARFPPSDVEGEEGN